MPVPTLRQRFNALRKTMAWSWKDIDQITGRSDTGSNISKGVPNWARLAIVANERYQHLLRLHIIDAVRREIGYEWTLRQRSDCEFTFTPPHPVGHHITLSFSPAQLLLLSNSPHLSKIIHLLNEIHPSIKTEKRNNGNTATTFCLTPTNDPPTQLKQYLDEHALPD
ncbi:hypothetical protein FUA23_11245 [Neolewinella aurantiaca]|uniref:Uncharacterized protein n=1 Tax=Neolewinella aurantiaca TaxID=2602767 RepID=A0A5C7FHU2_9BACT|nr:hypothetical protein [Neolewinella aurantiaca]TXF89313.1 hypothetical protein FUA23_11245 [Neolewinella aurantiaca]